MLHQGEIIVFGTPDEVRSCTEPIVQAFINPDMHTAGPPSEVPGKTALDKERTR